MVESQKFVVVSVSMKRKLVRLADVSEIVAMVALSAEDSALGNFRGLLNLRGEAVPVFDLRGPNAPLASSRFILVSQADTNPIGVIVDDVHGVVTVASERLARRTVDRECSVDCAEIDGQLLTVIQPTEAARA